MAKVEVARRPIKVRNTRWASRVAAWLGRVGVRPNAISIASVFFAAGVGLCLAPTEAGTGGLRGLLFLAAGILIQMRLLCNLLMAWWRSKAEIRPSLGRSATNCLTDLQMFLSS